MKYLDDALNNLIENNKKVDQVVSIGNEVSEWNIGFLNALCKDPIFTNQAYQDKLKTTISEVEKINNHFEQQYEIIFNQGIVLLVSNFESFQSDLFRGVVNNNPYLIDWGSIKSLNIETEKLKYYTPTVADLLLESLKEKVNFQNIESSKDFLKNYLGVPENSIQFDIVKIKKWQQLRHVIIHKNSVIDEKFLNSVKKFSENCYNYKNGDLVKMTKEEYNEAEEVFLKAANVCVKEIKEKMKNAQ